jgi:polysaccharide biosynthesis/export protein
MSVRSLSFYLIMCAAFSTTAVWAAGRAAAPKPSIEMSESASEPASEPEAAALPPRTLGETVAPKPAGPPSLKTDSAEPSDSAEPAEPDEPAEAVEAEDAGAADLPRQGAGIGATDAPVAVSAALLPVVPAAQAAPVAPAAPETVSWWREAASFLGLAPDPHPGETAEPAPGRPPATPDYIIGPGDLLGISVWRDESLTRSVVVLPDGKIAFPLVGELVAGGKTVVQLKDELERKLTRYVTESGLTVEVKQSNSMIIYLIGRVNVPGRQMMVASTNVLQGLAMAGGLNPFARRSEVKVFRKQGEKTSVFSFNYDDVSEGRHLETNIDLQKGDVILVP